MIFSDARYLSSPLVSVFRRVRPDRVGACVELLVGEGFPLIEVTMDSPHWREGASKITAGGGVWGAGTVMTIDDMHEAVEAGAQFLMSPVSDIEVIEAAVRLGVPFMPGCFTPTEIHESLKAGAEGVKIFPAVSMGTAGIASLRGPFPNVPVIATGGVSLSNAVDFLQAGATYVGIGGSLFTDLSLAQGLLTKFKNALKDS